MRRSLVITVGAVFLLGVLVAGILYFLHRGSPRYALLQMVEGIRERNYDKFYYYIDLKNIFSQLLQEAGPDLLPSEKEEPDELARWGRHLARKFAQHLLPRLFDNFEKELRKAINEYLGTLTTQELLALEAAVALADIRQSGEEAQVTLKFPRDSHKLRFTMSRNFPDRNWRVIAISYQDLKKLVKKELL